MIAFREETSMVIEDSDGYRARRVNIISQTACPGVTRKYIYATFNVDKLSD